MKINHFLKFALALCLGFGFVSCGSDDDNDGNSELWSGNLSDAKYEADAAAYKITNSSLIGSIELTASGNYLVMPPKSSYSTNSNMRVSRKCMFKSLAKSTRAIPGSGLFGEFEKLSDGSYKLNGFGVLGAYSNGHLDLTLDNGSSMTLDAVKQPNIPSNALNNRFCRTWAVSAAVEEVYDSNGSLLGRHEYSQSEIKEDFIYYVIVSKAGTYVQVDWDNTISSYGSWTWKNTDEQLFTWAEEYDGGEVTVLFNNNYATFVEYFYEDGYTYKSIVTTVSM